jgi:thiamine-phosphate pyrophosphorylase
MKLIVITSENFFDDEGRIINLLFQNGLEILHLRKPSSSIEAVKELTMSIDASFHKRIVLHDHFSLTETFDLRGVHLNRRNMVAPQKEKLSLSCSCHSFEEVVSSRGYDYVFLSPIFDSISKAGYIGGFTSEQLYEAKYEGIINERVMALGGITQDKIPLVGQFGFGGIVVLGAIWSDFGRDGNTDDLLRRFDKLKRTCN